VSSAAQALAGEFRDLTCHVDPCRTGANDREREPYGSAARDGLDLGHLERAKIGRRTSTRRRSN